MARVIAGMTTSLDGFVEEADGSAARLYPDLAALRGRQPKQDERLTFTFVTDGVESAIVRAGKAAGDRAIQVVGGPAVIQQLLGAGLVVELHIDVMPLLLGSGIRLLGASIPHACCSRSSTCATSVRGRV